jgi:hypothetical protein
MTIDVTIDEVATAMNNTPAMRLRLHNHPIMERQLNIPPGHVIIDSDTFLALINIHGRYVWPNAKLPTTNHEETKP